MINRQMMKRSNMADKRKRVQWYTKLRLTLEHDHPGELCDQDIRRLLYLIAKLELPLYLQGKDGWIGIKPDTTANAAIQALDDLTTETYDFSFRLNGAAIWTDSDGRIGALTARDSSIASESGENFWECFRLYCRYCQGEEPLVYYDENNYAYVFGRKGIIVEKFFGIERREPIDCCPRCGRQFKPKRRK